MLPLSKGDGELLNRLNRRPDLKKRVESILSISEDEGDGIVKADEAENRIREEVRRMGNEALTGWAESRVEKSGTDLPADGDITRSGQKKSIGTVPSEKQLYSDRSTDSRENDTGRSVGVPG